MFSFYTNSGITACGTTIVLDRKLKEQDEITIWVGGEQSTGS